MSTCAALGEPFTSAESAGEEQQNLSPSFALIGLIVSGAGYGPQPR
jgi:hypothetical protein